MTVPLLDLTAQYQTIQAQRDAAWSEKAVAVIPVHLFGQMAPMGEIRAWAGQKGLFILSQQGPRGVRGGPGHHRGRRPGGHGRPAQV